MSNHEIITRRRFFSQVAGGAVGIVVATQLPGALALAAPAPVKKTATDLVALGKSGVKFSRLGMGTGSAGGKTQLELGQKKFTALVRHAIERGVTYIDTADNYNGMHEMIAPAIAGVDREKIQIQCKIWPGRDADPLKAIDRFRKEVGTDYFDTLLIHCVQKADWVEQEKRLRDLLDQAKEKQIIRATGCSIHGLAPLRATAATAWGDIRLVRVNHKGAHMDGPTGNWNEAGQVAPVLENVRKMHEAGKGIIGMKLVGNGDFTNPDVRQQSIDFVMGLDCVDAVVIGFKSPAEIDEAIERINRGLAKAAAAKNAAKAA